MQQLLQILLYWRDGKAYSTLISIEKYHKVFFLINPNIHLYESLHVCSIYLHQSFIIIYHSFIYYLLFKFNLYVHIYILNGFVNNSKTHHICGVFHWRHRQRHAGRTGRRRVARHLRRYRSGRYVRAARQHTGILTGMWWRGRVVMLLKNIKIIFY